MFKKFKIRTKLLAGLVIVALLAGFVGCFSISKIKTLQNADSVMYSNGT